ncbi:MAG: efflux transporter outer rane subunit [Panacagrimonas sp.]|nr:efflux transporter outer membrane subunit [Panacagrimonas sp.]MCC2655527.1 efflux transporter outer rane subunit [Panacagrimonas sp.]
MRALLIGLAATALSACALGPDYARPDIDAPAAYVPGTTTDAPGSAADLDWWELYRDPALDHLIREAIDHNLDLRMAVARVRQAEAVLGPAGIALLPQLSASGGVERSKDSVDASAPGSDRIETTHSLRLGMSWELDLWGRLRRLREGARADLLSAEYGRRGVMVSLVADVATAWFRLASLDEQLKVTRATLDTREQFLKLTQAQSDRGVVSGLDVASAQAQLAQARANIPEFERQIALTEHTLSLLLGRNPGGFARATLEDASAMKPEVPAGLPSTLLERRPDILEAEQGLVAANAQVGAAKAALFPTISLTGSYGTLSTEASDLFSNGAETWSVGVNLLQPLLDAQRNLYRVDLADARKAEAIAAYEKAVRSGFREVADALVSRQKLAEVERAQNELVEAQQRAEEIATARYKVGYSSYFDVINADRDLFSSKLARSSARLDARLATVELYRALGGGWRSGPDDRSGVQKSADAR